MGNVLDVGRGTYSQDVEWDPSSGFPPGVVIAQPERPGVVIESRCAAPTPRAQGYWHRQCLGSGEIRAGRKGRGPSDPIEPDWISQREPCADAMLQNEGFYGGSGSQTLTCASLDAVPPSDPCERALKQLTALILNNCSGRLDNACVLDVAAEGCASTSANDLIHEIALLIQSGQCQRAAACAGAVNEGSGFGASLAPAAPREKRKGKRNLLDR